MVSIIQSANEKFEGIIINAAAFTHTSVAIRDALEIYKKNKIEVHISNIYKREEFRQKSLISDVVNGGIFGLGSEGYILAIIAMHKLLYFPVPTINLDLNFLLAIFKKSLITHLQ